MSLAEELQQLEDLRRRGSLSEAEFAQAKAAVLARFEAGDGPPPAADIQKQLGEIAREQEVARIDREWEQERERYMLTQTAGGGYVDGRHIGGYPVRYIPTRIASVGGGIVIAIFGLIWTVFAAAIGGGLFALFGVVFLAAGVGGAIYGYVKAGEYELAERAYRRRRARALAGEADVPARASDELDRRG